MKKILLANTNIEQLPYPVPPLGLCLLASSLPSGYQVSIFDGVFQPVAELIPFILDLKPDYIGFGIRNIDNMTASNIRYYVNRIMDNFILPVKGISLAPIILGGSGFSIFPSELMKLSGADYGIAGEAEQSFAELLDCLDNKRSLTHIPGLYIKETSYIVRECYRFTTAPLLHADIDLRIPYTPYLQRSSYPVQTKRGCLHRCIYCSYPIIEGSVCRTRDPKDIANEIEEVYQRLGAVAFEFVDSTFNDPRGHAEEICRQIISKNIPVSFRTMGINPVNVTRELIELMKKAGFRQIDCTPDTASERMLMNLKKNFRKEHIVHAARLFREAEMPVMWFFLFGGPGENRETIEETEEFISEHVDTRDMAHMSAGMRIYPGTGLHRIALEEKKITADQNLLEPVFYEPDDLTLDTIQMLLSEIAGRHHNCVPSSESAPSPEMIRRAMQLQEKLSKPEPMFRTLLGIRKEIMNK